MCYFIKAVTQVDDRKWSLVLWDLSTRLGIRVVFFTWQLETDVSLMKQNTWRQIQMQSETNKNGKAEGT